MRRSLSALLVCLPIAAAGVLAAHQFGYAITVPDAAARAAALKADGHGYFAELVYFALAASTVVLAGLFAAMRAQWDHGRVVRVDPRWFLLLSPLTFMVQEHAERAATGAGLLAELWMEPAFLLGLLLQIPFALAAWLVARLLIRAARSVAAQLAALRARRQRGPRRITAPAASREPRALVAVWLENGAPLRGPPAFLIH